MTEEEWKRQEMNLEMFLKSAFEREGGRDFIFRILLSAGVPIGGGFFSDPLMQAYSNGKRSVGEEVYRMCMKYAPEAFCEELIERQKDKRREVNDD